MRRTNSKEVKASVRRYLLNIEEDLTSVDMKEKFINEYGWNIPKVGEVNACIEWLRGLGVSVDYDYYNITKLLANWLDDTEEHQEKQIEKNGDGLYWLLLAREIVASR